MKISQRLGYSENTKLLIIHADDAGLAHSENLATIEAVQKGSVNSYSIMVTCKGFKEMAEFAKNNNQFDYGVHLTLTCEWKNYKWSPILPIAEVSSLVDKNGHFYRSKDDFKNNGISIPEIKKELRAQIDKALEFGLKPTHLDCHMYTLGLKSEFLQVYKELGAEYKLPIFLSKQFIESFGLNANECISVDDFCVTNNILIGNYSEFEKGNLAMYYEQLLNNVKTGLNVFLLHTAFDTQEMKSITVDHPNFGSAWRQIDYDFITSDKCKEILQNNNIQLITWGEIKNILYPKSLN